MPKNILLLVALAILATAIGHADTIAAPGDNGVALYLDQDLFVPLTNQDRDYTMGIGVEVSEDYGPLYLMGDLVQDIGRLTGLDRATGRVYRSYLLGSLNYTPDDIGNPAPIFNDRPYASLLYLANKRVVADGHRALGVEMLIGMLGLDLAPELQRALHRKWRSWSGSTKPVDPAGWDHQISSGGEPVVRLRLADAHLLQSGAGEYGDWDLAGSWDASVGFQTNASVGLSARAGRLASDAWSLPYDPINRGNFVPTGGGDEWYLWTTARLRAVAYDALLQGQFRHSDVTVDSDDIRRMVWEGGVGVTRGWSALQLTLAVNAKAGDTHLSQAPARHVWGGMYLNWRY